jgi:hypothetical protein
MNKTKSNGKKNTINRDSVNQLIEMLEDICDCNLRIEKALKFSLEECKKIKSEAAEYEAIE